MTSRASRPAVAALVLGALGALGALALAGAAPAAAGPVTRPATIDFGADDDAPIEQYTAPPPDIQHPSLIRDKYRGVPEGAAGPQIDDPLAGGAAPTVGRHHWLELCLAGGMFDDGAASARAGLAVGVAGRFRFAERSFVAVRADWSRRGGAMPGAPGAPGGPGVGDAIDALGADAGLGATLLGGAPGGGALAVIGQLRGEVRLADQRDGTAVRRTGLGLAAAAELALPATPFSVGVRVEQGLTELVAGARDRAVLVELGVDLR